MTQQHVICLGEAMVELSLNPATPDRAGLGFAGDTLNTAIYLKRCAPDVRVSYATKLGRDALSDRMAALMTDERLDTELVLRDPERMPGLYAINTDETGERSFLYWRDSSAARMMFESPGLSFEQIGQADSLYFSAISLAILPQKNRESFLDWLPDYRARGGRVMFDSNYRPRLWSDTSNAQNAIKRAWQQTDIAMPSVDDEMALFGDRNSDAVLDRLRGWGVRKGALKRGALGPMAMDGTGPNCPPVDRVVDSTAAGDSFNAGYIAACLRDETENACLLAGHRLASTVVRHAGAIIPKDAMPPC